MAGDDDNDRYRAGQVDKELEIMNKTLTRFEEKLDDNLEWQRGVDARLTLGAEKFRTTDITLGEYGTDIEALKNKDRGVLAMASTIGGAIGSATAVLMRVLGW